MIRYLEQEEKGRTKELWKEAFSEDSLSFVDYYYEEKMKDNRVLVFEREGQIVSMLHRNPYRIWLRGAECSCDYLVGIATKAFEDCRLCYRPPRKPVCRGVGGALPEAWH